jgi:DNA polymerase III epsilon subunit-like protein
MESQSKFKTLVVIDLETTGLVEEQPKITELAMVAVDM